MINDIVSEKNRDYAEYYKGRMIAVRIRADRDSFLCFVFFTEYEVEFEGLLCMIRVNISVMKKENVKILVSPPPDVTSPPGKSLRILNSAFHFFRF